MQTVQMLKEKLIECAVYSGQNLGFIYVTTPEHERGRK